MPYPFSDTVATMNNVVLGNMSRVRVLIVAHLALMALMVASQTLNLSGIGSNPIGCTDGDPGFSGYFRNSGFPGIFPFILI